MLVCEFWVDKSPFKKYIRTHEDLSIECINKIDESNENLYKFSEELTIKEINKYALRVMIKFRIKFKSFKKIEKVFRNQLYTFEQTETQNFIVFKITANMDSHSQLGEYSEHIKMLSRVYSTYLCYSLFSAYNTVNKVLTRIYDDKGSYYFKTIGKVDYEKPIRIQFEKSNNKITFK